MTIMVGRSWLASLVAITLCGAFLTGCAGNRAPTPSSSQTRVQLRAYWKVMGPTMSGLVSDLGSWRIWPTGAKSLPFYSAILRDQVAQASKLAADAAQARPPAELSAPHARFVRALDAALAAMSRRVAAGRPIAAQLAAIWTAGGLWQNAVERYAATLDVPLSVQTSTPRLLPTNPY